MVYEFWDKFNLVMNNVGNTIKSELYSICHWSQLLYLAVIDCFSLCLFSSYGETIIWLTVFYFQPSQPATGLYNSSYKPLLHLAVHFLQPYRLPS